MGLKNGIEGSNLTGNAGHTSAGSNMLKIYQTLFFKKINREKPTVSIFCFSFRSLIIKHLPLLNLLFSFYCSILVLGSSHGSLPLLSPQTQLLSKFKYPHVCGRSEEIQTWESVLVPHASLIFCIPLLSAPKHRHSRFFFSTKNNFPRPLNSDYLRRWLMLALTLPNPGAEKTAVFALIYIFFLFCCLVMVYFLRWLHKDT